MFRKIILPLLAVCGVVFAAYSVVTGQRQTPPAAPVAEPARPEYASYVAGAGLVEASGENIAVGTTVQGVVTEVYVHRGQQVKAGTPLFKIDDRDLQAELAVRQAAAASAEAHVKTEQAALADVTDQLNRWQAVADTRAVSRDELQRRRFAVQIQQAKLNQAQADLASARAQVEATRIELDRRIVRAPVDGELLQVKIRPGEYAPAGALPTPLMLIGDTRTLHVRVDVDENDAWRVRPEAAATASVRGNPALKTGLRFVGIEPYVIPKKSLTGDSAERVDTRVLQVLYAFDRGSLPVYVGQQMDVFIEAPPASVDGPVAATAAATTSTRAQQ
jgi:multidrug resistance efflux pump